MWRVSFWANQNLENALIRSVLTRSEDIKICAGADQVTLAKREIGMDHKGYLLSNELGEHATSLVSNNIEREKSIVQRLILK